MHRTSRFVGKVLLTGMLGFGLAATGLSPAEAAVYPNTGHLDVVASGWNSDSAFTVAGSGFGPNEQVRLHLAYKDVAIATTDGSGNFGATAAQVPYVHNTGTYNLTAKGLTSGHSATYAFNVQPFNPWGEPSTYWTPAGSYIKFSGHRFANDEHVDMYLEGQKITGARTDVNGEFSKQGGFTLPDWTANKTVHFTMVGARSHASAAFTVSVGPKATPASTTTTTRPPSTTTTTRPPSTVPPTTTTSTTVPPVTTSTTLPPVTTTPTTTRPPSTTTTTTPPVTAPATTTTTRPPSTTTSTTSTTSTTVPPTTTSTTAPPVTVPPTTTSTTTPPVTTPPTTTPPTPVQQEVTLASSTVTQQRPGQIMWQSVVWQGSSTNNACDFRVTAVTPVGGSIAYPSDQSYTTPSRETTLSQGQTDYTAVLLRLPANAVGTYDLQLTATYTPCGPGTLDPTPKTLTTTVAVPVNNSDVPFDQDTPELGPVSTGSDTAVQIYYTGYAPDLSNFQVRVTDNSGIGIIYPAERTYTTPNKRDYIEVTDTDYVGIRLITDGVAPGFYVLQLTTTYGEQRAVVPSTIGVRIV